LFARTHRKQLAIGYMGISLSIEQLINILTQANPQTQHVFRILAG
jgi:hypothetical protein